jgi:hypothetical protein
MSHIIRGRQLKTENGNTARVTALHLRIGCNVNNLLPGTTGVGNFFDCQTCLISNELKHRKQYYNIIRYRPCVPPPPKKNLY